MSKGDLYTSRVDFACYADDPNDPKSLGAGDALWVYADETFLLDLGITKTTIYDTARHVFLLVNKNVIVLLGDYAVFHTLILVGGKD